MPQFSSRDDPRVQQQISVKANFQHQTEASEACVAPGSKDEPVAVQPDEERPAEGEMPEPVTLVRRAKCSVKLNEENCKQEGQALLIANNTSWLHTAQPPVEGTWVTQCLSQPSLTADTDPTEQMTRSPSLETKERNIQPTACISAVGDKDCEVDASSLGGALAAPEPMCFPFPVGADAVRHARDADAVSGSSTFSHASKDITQSLLTSVHHVPTDISFQSSFLRLSDVLKEPHAASEETAVTVTNEKDLFTPNRRSNEHLEVALNDAELGNISVRAEIKEGMLHTSIVGLRQEAFIDASALYSFLSSSQVDVHSVRLGLVSSHTTAEITSSSFVSAGSSSSGRERHAPQQEQRRSSPARATDLVRRAIWNRDEFRPRNIHIMAQTRLSGTGNVSIHI